MHYFWRRVHWGLKYFYISVGLYLSYVKLYRRNASSTRLIVHQGTRVLIYYDKLAKPKIGTLFCSAAPKQTRRITKPGNPKSLHQYHGKLFSKEEEPAGPAKTIKSLQLTFSLGRFLDTSFRSSRWNFNSFGPVHSDVSVAILAPVGSRHSPGHPAASGLDHFPAGESKSLKSEL